MAESGVTKKVLAYALKNLMETRPLNKITVGDICEACDMNRKSFYYHFQDKYDLVNWIFYTEFFDISAGLSVSVVKNALYKVIRASSADALVRLCEFFEKNREFYRNALKQQGQNSFYEYLGEVITPVISSRLSPFFSRDPYREFYTDLLMHTYRDAIVRWVMEGCKIPPKTFVRLLYNAANVMSKLKPSNE